MQLKDRAIVLQAIKYNDAKYIIKLYTWHNGLITVHARVSSGKSAKLRTSLFQPLQILETDYSYRQNKEVQQLSEAVPLYYYKSIHTDFRKLSVFQFLTEVLQKVLREHQAHPELFEFITKQLTVLDETEHMSPLFHHHFLTELLKHLGLRPDNNFSQSHCYFDFREGKFTPVELAYPLGLNMMQSELFHMILLSGYNEYKFTYHQREELLDALLNYYTFHVPGFGILKSLAVLKEISAA